jgi:N-acylneuraminate cytidylyltransferase
MNICIIPARGGSKRIVGKNIKPFLGKPIIAYSIEAALSSGLFDEVMVSTDDIEIAEIAKKYGASVPFYRSLDTANDHATTYQVITEVISEYKDRKQEFEFTCCLYATAPFVTGDKLVSAFNEMKDNETDAVFSAIQFSYPVQRGLSFQDNVLRMKWPENVKKRSQDLEKMYHDSGQFYFYNTDKYLALGGVFKMNSTAIIVSELEAQDIDTETDWKLAELKYELGNNS